MEKKVLPDEDLGPKGLGDPYSTKLRKVEYDVLIPKLMRDKSRTEKCLKEVKEFNECCKEHTILNFHFCKPAAKIMFDCQEYWFTNPEFKKECTLEYLEKRKQYRLTGIRDKMKRVG